MFRLIFYMGAWWRNAEIFKQYAFLKSTESWSREQLEDYQLKRLKELLAHAYEHSSFYRERFSKAGMTPGDIYTLQDLASLPRLSKDKLRSQAEDIQISTKDAFKSETSGSTGEPLVFYRGRNWDAAHRAAIYRGYSWYGVRPWDRNGYFWGFNIATSQRLKTKFLDFLQHRFRCFSYEDEELRGFLKKLRRARYLEGYSSMIGKVAQYINDTGRPFHHRLLMIKGTSEKIKESYQQEVQKAFGQRIVSEYGAAEAGIIAFECPEGHMHITSENVIVEEEDGQILVTNLVSHTFPIIRYQLGDYVQLDFGTQCECGRQHPIVSEVHGRVGETIKGLNKEYPSLTLYYVAKNLANAGVILDYQAIQRKKGHLQFDIFADVNEEILGMIMTEFDKYFGADLKIDMRTGLSRDVPKSKRKDFISEIS